MLKPCAADCGEIAHYPILSELGWIIVDMARRDGPLSFNPDGLWAGISRSLFRVRVPRRLAIEAEEALRRFCVRAWYWNSVRASDLQAFVGAGYSHVQALQILAHVAGERGYCPTIEERAG
jgi:hypothetical protein